MTFGPMKRRHGPTGVPADHFPPRRSRFVAVDHQGRVTALVADGADEELEALAALSEEERAGVNEYALAIARANALRWATANQVSVGKPPAEAPALAATVVEAMSEVELLDQFLDTEQVDTLIDAMAAAGPAAQYTERRTPVSFADLAEKIEHLRQRQREAPEVERMRVKLSGTDLELDMAVRWDPEAIDPFARIDKDGTVPKGAFVSTLPGAASSHAMVAAGADVPQIVENPGGAWHAILCVEGLRTDEDPGREIMPGACQFPDLPVSLRLQIEDEGGHWGAVTCGRIDTMERQEMQGYNAIPATGIFGTNEHGQLAQLLVEEQTQRFISIDPRDCDIEIVEIEITTQTSGIGYYGPDDDEDDDGTLYEWWVRYTNLTIGAATIVATPALQQAVIAMANVELPETPIAVATAPPTSVTVTASGEPSTLPSRALFEDPGFHVGDPRLVRQADGHYACPLTVDRTTRRVFGHIAYWGANHTGLPGQNRKPPHSPTYAYFMTGARRTAEGDTVAVGNLTMGCGHAAVSIRNAEVAKAHYQPAGPAHYDGGYGAVQMADVTAGEDDFGIWASGVLCEGVTEEQIRRFESMGMSGDWRMIAGKLHMVACLAVPVPGFPIAREDALVASAEVIDLQAVRAGVDSGSGDVFALVAAGRVRHTPVEERLSNIERTLDALLRERSEEAVSELLSIL